MENRKDSPPHSQQTVENESNDIVTPKTPANDAEQTRTLEQERINQRHALKVMEDMEKYCEMHSNTLLNFTSPAFKEYFEALHIMNRLNFEYLQSTLSETQLQQLSFLMSEEYLTDIENMIQLQRSCNRYCESVMMTPHQEIQFLEACQSENVHEYINTYLQNTDISSDIFGEIYTQYTPYISFANIPDTLKNNAEIVKIGAEKHPDFSFLDVPQDFFARLQTPQEMSECFQLATTPQQANDIFTCFLAYPHFSQSENIEQLALLLPISPQEQEDIFAQVRNTLQQEAQMRNSYQVQYAHFLPISQENYHHLIQISQTSTDSQEKQNINRLLQNYLQNTPQVPPQDRERIQSIIHTYQAQSSHTSNTPGIGEYFGRQSLRNTPPTPALSQILPDFQNNGIVFNLHSTEINENGEQIVGKFDNMVFSRSADGNLIANTTLGKRMEFDATSQKSMENFRAITLQVQNINRTGIGHLGNNFMDIVDMLNRRCPHLIPEMIRVLPSENEFISERHFQILTQILQKLQVLPNNIHYHLSSKYEPMSSLEFDARTEHIPFLAQKSFYPLVFEESLDEISPVSVVV